MNMRSILSILLLLLNSCWLMHDTVSLQIINNSSYPSTINSSNMNFKDIIINPNESKQYYKAFTDNYCSVDFSYQNTLYNEKYIWHPYFESRPSDWSLIIELNDSGIIFKGAWPSEWNKIE